MVEQGKGMISPSLSRKLKDFSKVNELAISREMVKSAIDFLANHTDLSQKDIDQVVEASITAVHKKAGIVSNYEGDEELDPKSFGKEVVLVCTENGIKIKRVPKDVQDEVKENFENFDEGVLDSTYTILNMQPDLTPEDRGQVVVDSLLDTLGDNQSFDGYIDYENFGNHIKKNVALVRSEKGRSEAAKELVDIFLGQDNFKGDINEAFEYFDDIYNFEEYDFAEYFDGLTEEGHSNFENGFEYMSRASRRERRAARRQSRVSRRETRHAKHDVRKAARKAKRKERGSLFGNILTGGALGAAKRLRNKIKAKKDAKQAADDASQAISDTSTAVSDSPDPSLASAAEALQAPAASSADAESTATDSPAVSTPMAASSVAPTKSDTTTTKADATPPKAESGGGSGSGGGGGGGGDNPAPESTQATQEEQPEDSAQEDESSQQDVGDDSQQSEDTDTDTEDTGYENKLPESDDLDSEQGNYTGVSKLNGGWYPTKEDNPEIANFFGLNNKSKEKEKGPLNLLFNTDSFMGSENVSNDTWKIIASISVIAIVIFVYLKYKKN